MKDFVKEFTVIDFLGMLPAGVLVILLLSYDWSEHLLWQGYFGDTCGEATKLAILLVAGYFVGMLLHELGDWVERALFHFQWLDPRRWAAYRVCEGETQAEKAAFYQQVKPKTPAALAAAAKEDVHGRLALFDGFHVAMRNLLVAVAVLAGYLLVTGGGTPLGKMVCRAFSQWYWRAGGVAAVFLCAVRGYHYLYLKYKYVYENISPSADL